MKSYNICLITFIAFSNISCATKTPTCSDEKTLNLVKKIFQQGINGEINANIALKNIEVKLDEFLPQDNQLSVSSIRTDKYDDVIKKYECSASLEVNFLDRDRGNIIKLSTTTPSRTLKINDKTVSTEVKYTSQMTDDKKEYYTELSGHNELSTFVLSVAAGHVIINQMKSEQSQNRVELTGVLDAGSSGYSFMNQLDDTFYFFDYNNLTKDEIDNITNVCELYPSKKKCSVDVQIKGKEIIKIYSAKPL